MFDISIIIVSYNTKNLTLSCIKSIVEQRDGLNKEVIVVDNGSTDGSLSALLDLDYSATDFKLKIIQNNKNLGFAKANNKAIKESHGKYILLLNSDTVVKKDSIIRMYEFACHKKDAGAVVPRLLNPDGTIQASVFLFPTILRAINQYWLGKKGILDKYYPVTKKEVVVESAVMASFLITPEALKLAGLLNEKYFMYFEDLDYCRKLKKSDLKIYYLPDASVYHFHGASGKKLFEEKNQWRRLISSSKIYHGIFKHYLYNFIIWSGQKWQRLNH